MPAGQAPGAPMQPGAVPKWSVVSQQEVSRPDAQGRFQPGVLVGFQTDTGLQGQVFVPDSQYTAEAVKTAVVKRLQVMHAVSQLGG